MPGARRRAPGIFLFRRAGEHGLDADAIAPVGAVDQDMGDRAHQLAVLEDGGAAHG